MVKSRRPQKKQDQTKSIRIPNILISIPFWLSLLFIIYFIDPNTFGVVPFFLFIFFVAVFFTVKKLSITIALTLFLILKYFKMGNIINLLLLVAIVVAYEWYSKKTN